MPVVVQHVKWETNLNCGSETGICDSRLMQLAEASETHLLKLGSRGVTAQVVQRPPRHPLVWRAQRRGDVLRKFQHPIDGRHRLRPLPNGSQLLRVLIEKLSDGFPLLQKRFSNLHSSCLPPPPLGVSQMRKDLPHAR